MRFATPVTRVAATAIAALAFAVSAHAQALPDAQQILTRYREVTGSAARHANVKSMHAVGEFSVPAAGMTGNLEVWSARPNRSAMKVTIQGLGEIRSGFTGEHGWSINPMEGPRLLTGAELLQAQDEADFDSHLRPEARIASATTVEKTTIGGSECFRIKLVWKTGRETHDCFSVETGHLVASQGKTESSMGTLESTIIYSDVKDFDGIKIPTRLVTQLMGAEQVIVLKQVHFNVVSESVFDPPAEVKALIKK
jgi:hypothetical protein